MNGLSCTLRVRLAVPPISHHCTPKMLFFFGAWPNDSFCCKFRPTWALGQQLGTSSRAIRSVARRPLRASRLAASPSSTASTLGSPRCSSGLRSRSSFPIMRTAPTCTLSRWGNAATATWRATSRSGAMHASHQHRLSRSSCNAYSPLLSLGCSSTCKWLHHQCPRLMRVGRSSSL